MHEMLVCAFCIRGQRMPTTDCARARARDYTRYLRAAEDYYVNVTYTENCTLDKMADIIEVSKKRSSFLTKYF